MRCGIVTSNYVRSFSDSVGTLVGELRTASVVSDDLSV
jgi:hypothetical protein